MESLKKLNLVSPLKDFIYSKPLIGICLGMQLLMQESEEFGKHEGLGIIEGRVVKFNSPIEGSRKLKVPHVGWNRIFPTEKEKWVNTPLENLKEGSFMYFVHSFYVEIAESSLALSTSRYGQIEFCSSLKHGNIFAFQFHPERSGLNGLDIYRNIASLVKENANI